MKRQEESNGKQFVNHGSIFESNGYIFEAIGSIIERHGSPFEGHGRPFEGYKAFFILKSFFTAGEFYTYTNETLILNFKFYFK